MHMRKDLQAYQKKLIGVLHLACATSLWMSRGSLALSKWKDEKVLHDAARKIQRSYKKYSRNKKMITALLTRQKLANVEWRIRFWLRCCRRRLHAGALRQFLKDFSVQQVPYIIFTFRHRVVRVQRMMKSFLACKKARRLVLEKIWYRMERKVAMMDPEPDFKARRKSVLPEMGSKLFSAGRRFSILERQLKSKNLLVETRLQMKDKEGEEDLPLLEQTPKGVPVELMRYLIRWFVEEQRMSYAAFAFGELKKSAEAPNVTEDHARALLAGTLLHVEVSNERKWPVFSLYKNKAARAKLFEVVEEAMKDQAGTVARVKLQKEAEHQLNLANRYDIGAEDDDEDGSKGGDGSGSGEDGDESDDDDDDEPMTVEEELEENRELAEKYNTTPQEVQEFREMFQLVDLDHGGSIDSEELGKLLDLLGMAKSEEEVVEMVRKIDTTDSDEVFFPDFVRAMKSDKPVVKYTEGAINNAFDFFGNDFCNTDCMYNRTNGNKPGHLDKKQLIYALTSFPGKWGAEDAENYVHDAGLGGSSVIEYSTYVKVMFQLAKT